MSIFYAIIAAILDPIKLVVAVGVFTISFNRYMLALGVVAGGLISEAILTKMQITRQFGDGLVVQLIGSLVVTVVVYLVWLKIKSTKKQDTAG